MFDDDFSSLPLMLGLTFAPTIRYNNADNTFGKVYHCFENVPAYGVGYITKFEVDADYLKNFKAENVGGEIHFGYLQTT